MTFPLDFDGLALRVDSYTEMADERAATSAVLRLSALLMVLLSSLLALGALSISAAVLVYTSIYHILYFLFD